MDTLYHIVLGLFLLLVIWGITVGLPPLLNAMLISAFILYFREVTQDQTKNYDSDFRYGWDFRAWSKNKNIETWIPIGVVFIVASILWINFT